MSYAYLHAIVSKAGGNCHVANRHADNRGIDAKVELYGPFPGGGDLNEVSLFVQLKATVQPLSETATHMSYRYVGLGGYDKMRAVGVSTVQRLLVLFRMPALADEWLACTEDQLVLKKAAYWTSLSGAPASDNDTSQTVYVPKRNLLTVDALAEIGARISRGERLAYEAPDAP